MHGGPTPHDVLHDAVDWGRVVVATLARGIVATLLGLALWAAAPAVIGWQPTTVMTGSMEPRLVPGDVVVSRPVSAEEVREGKILLADDPDQPGHLRMHRYVEAGPGGTLVTKGDANPQRDSTPLEPSAVHGVAFLRIPFVGSPILWLRQGEWAPIGLLVLGLGALLALCTVDGSLRRLAGADTDTDTDTDGGDFGGDGAGSSDDVRDPSADDVRDPVVDDRREARDGAATRLQAAATVPTTRRALRRRDRRVRRVRLLGGGAAVVLLVSGAVGTLVPTPAVAAPFSRATSTVASLGTATAVAVPTLTCVQTTADIVTIEWTYPDNIGTPNSFDLMNGTTQVATAAGTAKSLQYRGSGLLNLGTSYDLTLRTNLGGSWLVTNTTPVKVRVTSLLGSGSATCVR
uniref:S24/S26 family peptidase n=1 Tax=Neobacillus citreus TaxID=2833578 RepID=A0A942SZ16_9BACI